MAKSTKRSVKKNVARGIVHVKATFNNTHVTITTPTGDTVSRCPRHTPGGRVETVDARHERQICPWVGLDHQATGLLFALPKTCRPAGSTYVR